MISENHYSCGHDKFHMKLFRMNITIATQNMFFTQRNKIKPIMFTLTGSIYTSNRHCDARLKINFVRVALMSSANFQTLLIDVMNNLTT